MSVAFVEALINELLSDASEGQTFSFPGLAQPTSELFGTMWRRLKKPPFPKILMKYQDALALAGKIGFDPDASPYREVNDVNTLRNALVHYKPESIPTESTRDQNEIHQFETRLRRYKFCENPLISGGNAFYPDKCLSFGCAAWAFEACVQLADEFCSRLGIQAPYCYEKPRLPALTKDVP